MDSRVLSPLAGPAEIHDRGGGGRVWWEPRAEELRKSVGVVFTHGFGGSSEMTATYAKLAASHGFPSVAIDMSSLLGATHSSRLKARAKNADRVVENMRKLNVDQAILVGHSAGAAVSLEAAFSVGGLKGGVLAVVMLDGVPWLHTINHENFVETEYCDVFGDSTPPPPPAKTLVVSLRGKSDSWNHYNLVQHLLVKYEAPVFEYVVPNAHHGDFMCNSLLGHYDARGVKGFLMKKLLRIQTTRENQTIVTTFLLSALRRIVGEEENLPPGVERMELPYQALSKSKLLKRLPPFLK